MSVFCCIHLSVVPIIGLKEECIFTFKAGHTALRNTWAHEHAALGKELHGAMITSSPSGHWVRDLTANGGTCSTENITDKTVATLPPLLKDHWAIISTDLILVFQSCFCCFCYHSRYHSQILKALQKGWLKHLNNFLKIPVLYQPVKYTFESLGHIILLTKRKVNLKVKCTSEIFCAVFAPKGLKIFVLTNSVSSRRRSCLTLAIATKNK